MFTSEINIKHVKLEFYYVHYFLEFEKALPFILNTAVIVFHLSRLVC